MSHYFENDTNLKEEKREFFEIIKNQKVMFSTGSGIFSKKKLDAGSKVLLEYLPDLNDVKTVLDCGCGYGAISIFLKKLFPHLKITGIDINLKALAYAKENALKNNVNIDFFESDFFKKIDNKFDLIISNPPIRIGKEKLFKFYKDSKNYLTENGTCLFVVAKDKGAESSVKYLNEIYNIVDVIKKKKGYFIIYTK